MAELPQLKKRIDELNILAYEIDSSARLLKDGTQVQPRLSEIVQKWYRGCRELLVQSEFSGLREFEACYIGEPPRTGGDIEGFSLLGLSGLSSAYDKAIVASSFPFFLKALTKARALIASSLDEIQSRELSFKTQLSFEVAVNEFQTAQEVLDASDLEPLIRASGVIARVALERHLFTVIDVRKITIIVNPPNKKKAEAHDAIMTLVKNNVINAIQRSELESLFTIANHCAHPREAVTKKDVNRLIIRGQEMASVIM